MITGSDCIFSVSIPSNSIAWHIPVCTPIFCASVRYIYIQPGNALARCLLHFPCTGSGGNRAKYFQAPQLPGSWSMCRKLPQHIFQKIPGAFPGASRKASIVQRSMSQHVSRTWVAQACTLEVGFHDIKHVPHITS